jgi:DNA-binding response OmpR family regulator
LKKILIVDDNEEIIEILESNFKLAGFKELFHAKDGENAIVIARKEKPDIILMDVTMPGEIEGIEATRILKNDPESKRSVIMMLTAKTHRSDVERGYKAGADYYFAKPFSPLALIRRIEEILETGLEI